MENTMLRGKRVCLVGPAGYMQGLRKGTWIDSHDLVVRVNYSVPVKNTADYGKRTDILYWYLCDEEVCISHLTEPHIFRLKKAGVKRISIAFRQKKVLDKFTKIIKGRLKYNLISDGLMKSVRGKMAKAPMTGTLAIADLLAQGVSELNVVGFDYYISGYCKDYKGTGIAPDHGIADQVLFIDSIKDRRLHMDSQLRRAIRTVKEQVSIIIPYRENPERKEVSEFLFERYRALFPDFELIISECDDDPFNRSKAINLGAARSRRKYLLIADSDVFAHYTTVMEMLVQMKCHPMVRGRKLIEITEDGTRQVLYGDRPTAQKVESKRDAKCIFMVERTAFYSVGGFDERFIGWGGEDNAFYHAMKLIHRVHKIDRDVYHLWHPVAPDKGDWKDSENYKLWKAYELCETVEHLKAILCK